MAGYTGGGGGGGESFGIIERAETFAESDVTVTQDLTTVANGRVGLPDSPATGEIPTSMSKEVGETEPRGIVFTPDVEVTELTAHTADETGGQSRIILGNADTDTDIDTEGVSFNGGSSATFTGLSLSPGTQYRVTMDAGGDTYDGAMGSYDFPEMYGWGQIDGGYDGSVQTDQFYNIDRIDVTFAPPLTGSATVEWPQPPDLFGWDTATFQRTLDGETVEVFVEESTDGGSTWTEVTGPIARGDDIPVSSSDEMRFRVDLSRTDTANEPRLEALYRRYTV